jgi:hypothetical protein
MFFWYMSSVPVSDMLFFFYCCSSFPVIFYAKFHANALDIRYSIFLCRQAALYSCVTICLAFYIVSGIWTTFPCCFICCLVTLHSLKEEHLAPNKMIGNVSSRLWSLLVFVILKKHFSSFYWIVANLRVFYLACFFAAYHCPFHVQLLLYWIWFSFFPPLLLLHMCIRECGFIFWETHYVVPFFLFF